MIAQLISQLRDAVRQAITVAEIERHLAGVAAIMDSHFRYEERQLLRVLETLDLDEDPRDVLGRVPPSPASSDGSQVE